MKTPTDFRVQWEMDFDPEGDVCTPLGVASRALKILHDPDHIATVFTVIDPDGRRFRVDVTEGTTRELFEILVEDADALTDPPTQYLSRDDIGRLVDEGREVRFLGTDGRLRKFGDLTDKADVTPVHVVTAATGLNEMNDVQVVARPANDAEEGKA